jgi:hypothetical protein
MEEKMNSQRGSLVRRAGAMSRTALLAGLLAAAGVAPHSAFAAPSPAAQGPGGRGPGSPAAPPVNPDAGKWRVLFDGSQLNGLAVQPPSQAKQVTVQDGVIRILGSREGGWLRSDKKYADFTMELEIRFIENSTPYGGGPYGNNGLILRSPEISISGRNWPGRGFEMEMWDQSKRQGFAKDGQILGLQPGVPDGKFSFDIGAAQRAYKPTGEWNKVVIIADGNRMWTKLNGEWLGTAYNVAHPDGHVGFQIEDGITEIRNVRIMEHAPDTWTPDTIVPLFKDGKLSGMSISKPEYASKMSIENGVLKLAGPGGWLKTDKMYTSYTLRTEFRTVTDNANGGVYLRARGDQVDASGWPMNTDKVQVLSQREPPPTAAAGDPRWFGAFLSRGTAGGRSTLDTGAVRKAWRGVGEWQEAVYEVDGTHVNIKLNGVLIGEGDNVANLAEGGFVGLEIGPGVTEYRRIEIQGYTKD